MARITPLLAAITSVTSTSFLVFGYDQGLMSGVVLSLSWLRAMGHPTPLEIGTITGLHALGALSGAVSAALFGEKYGRKRVLLTGATLVFFGGAVMALASGKRAKEQFCLARMVGGWGVGLLTAVAPVYQAEVSRVGERGLLVCCQLTMMLVGLALAYWIDYAFYFVPGEMQWRVPVGLQCVFALYVIAVGMWLPDTPRWLMRNGRKARGRLVLARLRRRSVGDLEVKKEVDEILEAIRTESKTRGGWGDLFRDNGIMADRRFFLAVGIQFMQQCSGINVVTYYSSTLYRETLGMGLERAMLLGCWTQMWYICASLATWYTIDRVGRRRLLIIMAVGMSLVLIGEAVAVGMGTTKAAIAAVVFVFLFEACFTWGWMACVTPIGIEKMGPWFYVVWAVLNLVNAVVVWLCYPETGGLTLEAVDSVFSREEEGSGNTRGDAAGVTGLQQLQWSRVRVAAEMVQEARVKKPETVLESEGLLADEDTRGYRTIAAGDD